MGHLSIYPLPYRIHLTYSNTVNLSHRLKEDSRLSCCSGGNAHLWCCGARRREWKLYHQGLARCLNLSPSSLNVPGHSTRGQMHVHRNSSLTQWEISLKCYFCEYVDLMYCSLSNESNWQRWNTASVVVFMQKFSCYPKKRKSWHCMTLLGFPAI